MSKSDKSSFARFIIGPRLIPIGVSSTALGLLFFYLAVYMPYEFVRGLRSQHSALFRAYEVTSIVLAMLLPIGLLTTLVGSAIWARRGAPGNVLAAGLGIVILVLLTGHFIQLNGEADPIPVFVFLTVMLIAAIFIIFSVIRLTGR